jgi:tetratricopeptide (TPR) repeat protein
MRVSSRLLACAFASALSLGFACAQGAEDLLAQARAALASSRFADAQSYLESAIKSAPDSPDAHFLLGYTLFRLHKPADSLAAYTRGAQFRRPSPADLKVVASDYVLLNDLTDADKWFTEVVAAQPDDADTWYLLGRTKYNENNFAGARSCLERSLALRPRNVEAENNLGLVFKELDQGDQAAAAFQQAIDWQGDHPTDAQPFFNLGSMKAEQGSSAIALASLQRAATLAPGNPSIQEKLGDVQLALHNLPAAQRAFEQAITLAPTIAPLHFKLGQVYRRLGQTDLAQKEFAICQQLNSTHSSGKAPNPPAEPTPH